jgi:hypothetical protein
MHISVTNSVGRGGMLKCFNWWKSRDDRGGCSILLDTLEEAVDRLEMIVEAVQYD